MKVPMYAMASSAVLNIILDPLFIFTFGWGVKGAAIATVLARAIALVIIIAYFISDKTWIKLKLHWFSFKRDYVKGIFAVGVPSSLSNLSMSVGMFLLTVIVAGFGTEALAAYGIGFRLDSLAILPALGVSVAVVSLIGQNVGAGRYKRAKEMTFKAGFMATAIMSCIGFVFFMFPEVIVSLFSGDPLVVSYGVSFLRIVPLSYVVVGVTMAISGAFLGSGHAVPSLAINVLRVIVINVPLAYLLSLRLGVAGVWWGILASSLAASAIAVVWFRKGTWKKHVARGR
ncbi:MAG: MATE family efflux transporter [Candidatus Altiarchaeota archaeon]